jgi:hypothetical protein
MDYHNACQHILDVATSGPNNFFRRSKSCSFLSFEVLPALLEKNESELQSRLSFCLSVFVGTVMHVFAQAMAFEENSKLRYKATHV